MGGEEAGAQQLTVTLPFVICGQMNLSLILIGSALVNTKKSSRDKIDPLDFSLYDGYQCAFSLSVHTVGANQLLLSMSWFIVLYIFPLAAGLNAHILPSAP